MPVTYYTCTARERPNTFRGPADLRGALQQGDVKISIDVDSAGIEPRAGDRIALGTHSSDGSAEWLQIVSVEAPAVAGESLRYVCTCRK